MRSLRLADASVNLLSNQLLYADIFDQQMCMITKEGDFLVYRDREILFNNGYAEH